MKNSVLQPGSPHAKGEISKSFPFWGRFRGLEVGLSVISSNFASSRRTYPVSWRSLPDQLGHTPQVLDGGREGEFVVGTTEPM